MYFAGKARKQLGLTPEDEVDVIPHDENIQALIDGGERKKCFVTEATR